MHLTSPLGFLHQVWSSRFVSDGGMLRFSTQHYLQTNRLDGGAGTDMMLKESTAIAKKFVGNNGDIVYGGMRSDLTLHKAQRWADLKDA